MFRWMYVSLHGQRSPPISATYGVMYSGTDEKRWARATAVGCTADRLIPGVGTVLQHDSGQGGD